MKSSLCFLVSSLLAAVIGVPTVALAAEPPTIQVKLWDKSDGKDIVSLSTHTVKAGPVEFAVDNASSAETHEFMITRWRKSITSLPYDMKSAQVKEGTLKMLEGVEDMPPGTKTTVLLDLSPGEYVIFCNEPGHYKAGMETRFTVTR